MERQRGNCVSCVSSLLLALLSNNTNGNNNNIGMARVYKAL